LKKFILGIILSTAFIYLALCNVDYHAVIKALENVNFIFMVPTVILFTSLLFLKSLRWGFILAPLQNISQKKIFPITCVGFMAIALVPMRGGEIVRPYLINKNSEVPMSSALATIFVERVMDAVTLLLLLLYVLLGSNLSDDLIKASYTFVISAIIMIFILLILYYKYEKLILLLKPVLKKLPENVGVLIEKTSKNFLEGFKIISDPRRFAYTLLLSLLVWIVSGLGIYTLFLFHNFSLSLSNAFLVLIVTMLAISLPAAPGFLGNFQYGCILALSILYIPKGEALAFSMVYYLLTMGITIFFGLIFLPSTRFAIADIRKKLKI
jgi:glycosyltransferase 2 family protein